MGTSIRHAMRGMSLLLVCGIVLGAAAQAVAATPNPPITGRYSVKGFVGDTMQVILAIYPALNFTDGQPIPAGADVKIKVYRSYDEGKTYGEKGVKILKQTYMDFTNPDTGQNRFDPARISWIEVVCQTPVDPPKQNESIELLGIRADGKPTTSTDTTVYLAASVVVDGVESSAVNRYLTFRYAVGGIPGLVRYETPDTSGPAIATALSRVPAATLADRGGLYEGEYMLTAVTIPEAVRNSPEFREEGCQQALAQIDALKGKTAGMSLKVKSITNNELTGPRGQGFHPGDAIITMDPLQQGGEKQEFKADLVYYQHRAFVILTDTVENGSLEMVGDFMENQTEYWIAGPFRFKIAQGGKELAILHGMWQVKRRK